METALRLIKMGRDLKVGSPMDRSRKERWFLQTGISTKVNFITTVLTVKECTNGPTQGDTKECGRTI